MLVVLLKIGPKNLNVPKALTGVGNACCAKSNSRVIFVGGSFLAEYGGL